MMIDYNSDPDLPATRLTVDAVMLFQRFQQTADRERVDALLEAEVEQHLKLCELAILYAASNDCSWSILPEHPLPDVELWTCDRLKEAGFKIEHHLEGSKIIVPSSMSKGQKLETVDLRSYFTAKWLLAKGLSPKKTAAEWRRREKLEDKARKSYVPIAQSRIEDGKLVIGSVAWAAVLDHKYIVEVQEIIHLDMLCIFDDSGKCLHAEPTNVAYGATFGPDIGDVAQWEERATAIIDSLSAHAKVDRLGEQQKQVPGATQRGARKGRSHADG